MGASRTDHLQRTYSFEDLGQLRTLRDMQANTRISAKSIRASVAAMQRVAGMRNPLIEASFVRRGSRLSFRHGGALMDPLTQQLAFDFDTSPARQLRVVGANGDGPARQAAEMQDMFLRAVQLEENPATIPQAAEIYHAILHPSRTRPGSDQSRDDPLQPAPIRIGRGALPQGHDRRPRVCARILRSRQRSRRDAAPGRGTAAYQRAVALVPQYADAHYNLALAYERQGHRRRALRHWLAYVRLDPVGPWAKHAKEQARKILNTEKLPSSAAADDW